MGRPAEQTPTVIEGQAKVIRERLTAKQRALQTSRRIAETFGARKRRLHAEALRLHQDATEKALAAKENRTPAALSAAETARKKFERTYAQYRKA